VINPENNKQRKANQIVIQQLKEIMGAIMEEYHVHKGTREANGYYLNREETEFQFKLREWFDYENERFDTHYK
jgi:hypothetical protein